MMEGSSSAGAAPSPPLSCTRAAGVTRTVGAARPSGLCHSVWRCIFRLEQLRCTSMQRASDYSEEWPRRFTRLGQPTKLELGLRVWSTGQCNLKFKLNVT